jgi:hypothetical protein
MPAKRRTPAEPVYPENTNDNRKGIIYHEPNTNQEDRIFQNGGSFAQYLVIKGIYAEQDQNKRVENPEICNGVPDTGNQECFHSPKNDQDRNEDKDKVPVAFHDVPFPELPGVEQGFG